MKNNINVEYFGVEIASMLVRPNILLKNYYNIFNSEGGNALLSLSENVINDLNLINKRFVIIKRYLRIKKNGCRQLINLIDEGQKETAFCKNIVKEFVGKYTSIREKLDLVVKKTLKITDIARAIEKKLLKTKLAA